MPEETVRRALGLHFTWRWLREPLYGLPIRVQAFHWPDYLCPIDVIIVFILQYTVNAFHMVQHPTLAGIATVTSGAVTSLLTHKCLYIQIMYSARALLNRYL